MVRDDDGELRAFRNVCRHRGSRLLSGSGECGKAIRCRYHGWTYRLDGQLIGVPEGRQIPGLDKSQLGLFPARVEVFWGLVFVNLDIDATPLAELARRPARAPRALRARATSSRAPRSRRSQPANWKIVVDNYLEGYHVPIAHPGLMRLLDYKHYEVELHDELGSGSSAPLRDKPSGNLMERAYQRMVEPMPGLTEEDRRIWRYIFIYPNTAIDLYPDQVGIWQIGPDGPPGHRGPRAHAAAARARACARALAQFANRKVNELVSHEDVDLVANQQAGLETRDFEPGPLSSREAAVGWFADGEDSRGAIVARDRRASASSPRRWSGSRATASTTCGSPASRWTPACPPRSCTTTSRPARPCSAEALEYSFELAGDVRIGEEGDDARPRAPAARDGRPVPALPGPARARLDPLGRAVAARGAPPRAAPHRGAALRAHARLVRRGDRATVERRARAPTPSRWPTGSSRCATASASACWSASSTSSTRASEVWEFLAAELGLDRALAAS